MRNRPSPLLATLIALLAVLFLAGGASRPDALGQSVVRAASWVSLAIVCVWGRRAEVSRRDPVMLLLVAMITLSVAQLIPLPSGVWEALPGRQALPPGPMAAGDAEPWRSWSIVPGATFNAASSLVVPLAVGLLFRELAEKERAWVPLLMLILMAASAFVGLLQFAGIVIDNAFVNDTPGAVAGTFANRNHFALFLAMGCIVAPIWNVASAKSAPWRWPIAWGLVLIFILTILGSGSRAGFGLALAALVFAAAISGRTVTRSLRQYPRWVTRCLVVGLGMTLLALVTLAFFADRAVSINRLFVIDQGQDMRARALPAVLAAVKIYFPAGSGLGSFDPVFRMHEPWALLKPSVFNHAHNDFLEIALTSGLPGLALAAIAVGWWTRMTWWAWRAKMDQHNALSRLGSAMLLLVLLASTVDYPARTPLIMATVMIAASWLGDCRQRGGSGALPLKS